MSNSTKESFQISGEQVLGKVKELIKEGNIRRIVIKGEDGHVLLEIPLTFAAVGVLAAPVVSAIGALAALVTNCTLEIERKDDIEKGTDKS